MKITFHVSPPTIDGVHIPSLVACRIERSSQGMRWACWAHGRDEWEARIRALLRARELWPGP